MTTSRRLDRTTAKAAGKKAAGKKAAGKKAAAKAANKTAAKVAAAAAPAKPAVSAASKPARRPAAIMRAGEPTPLELLHEYAGLGRAARVKLAVRRIRSEWGTATSAMLNVGSVVVDAAYDGDPTAALAPEADENEIFQDITKSLGTLEGGPNKAALSVMRRIVAANRQLQSYHFWKVTPYGHKEILIRLADPPKMAEGAQQVVEQGWTHKQTSNWVDVQRAEGKKAKVKRGVPLKATRRALGSIIGAGDAKSEDRTAREYAKLPPAEQKKVRDELDRALAVIQRLRSRLRGDGES